MHPKVSLDIQGPLPTGELRFDLLEGRLDAALCFLPLEGEGINTKLLAESEFAIALPSAHRYAQSDQLKLSQLKNEPFVAYPAGRGFHLPNSNNSSKRVNSAFSLPAYS